MGLGWRHWAGAGGHELVEPSLLAARPGTPEGSRSRARGIGLEPVAWPSAGASIQLRLLAVCVARLVRLRLRLLGRHGFLQFRHHLSRVEAGGARERGSEFHRALRRDLPAGLDRALQLRVAWRYATRETHVVRRGPIAAASGRVGRRASP